MLRLAPLLALLAVSASAQTAMELGQAGRYAEAAELAEQTLADADAGSDRACEALVHAALSRTFDGEADRARPHLARFDAECADAGPEWGARAIDRVRDAIERGPFLLPTMSTRPPASAAGDDWPVADDPVALGLDAEALADHADVCARSGAAACVVVWRGQIVQELYAPSYAEPIEAMSSTKSVAGLLAGMLIGEGALAADDPVADYVPEWAGGAAAGVTVRHLLTMTSGLQSSHTDRPRTSAVGGVSDKDSLVATLPLVDPPGTVWAYSNEGTYLLSPVLRRAAGEPLEAYAARELFEPLGMENTRLHVYPDGQAWTHSTMWTTPRDLARIGQLMLHGGRWNGEAVVPADWIAESVRPSQTVNPAYGLLWWLDAPEGFAARGYLDTNLYVLPERDLVVVRMQAQPSPGARRYEQAAFEVFRRLAD
ncbi:serine hydrolase domain-containing protein [Rubrivirga sp. IMCC45206]|uniref:serine hydrolase domain-containing protein n=1 Tax=Rubrivirga sp. IMCC45206 TaxID=3391614 RepID=UPI00398FE562